MLIPSVYFQLFKQDTSLSRRVNANSQRRTRNHDHSFKLIKKGEC